MECTLPSPSSQSITIRRIRIRRIRIGALYLATPAWFAAPGDDRQHHPWDKAGTCFWQVFSQWIGLRENLNRKPWFLPSNRGVSWKKIPSSNSVIFRWGTSNSYQFINFKCKLTDCKNSGNSFAIRSQHWTKKHRNAQMSKHQGLVKTPSTTTKSQHWCSFAWTHALHQTKDYMEVSWKGGIPKSSVLIGMSIINQPF